MKILCFSVILVLVISGSKCNLKEIFSWKAIDFLFPNSIARELAITTKQFIPGAPVPIDLDVYTPPGDQKSKVFVSIPRFQDGVPVTLGYVTNQLSADGNPLIAPYPSWDWHRSGDCNGITSVYRFQIDECNRLWVLDTGKLGEKQICRPQLLVFSLKSNRLINRYRFPREQYKQDSLYVTPIVDIRNGKCNEAFVYIADVTGFSLVVYDHQAQRSWHIHNNLFYPYPPHGTFHINGESFDLMDGILGLALGPIQSNGDRRLYFHSLASVVESSVPTSVIRNYETFRNNPEAAARSFVPFSMERSSQSAAEAMDRNGVLFFGLMSDVAIGCWNSKHYPEFGGRNNEIIAQNQETLQFASGLKVITSRTGEQELWVMTVSFQKYMTGTLNSSETNFRIQAGFINELVRGTKCDVNSLSIEGGRLNSVTLNSK